MPLSDISCSSAVVELYASLYPTTTLWLLRDNRLALMKPCKWRRVWDPWRERVALTTTWRHFGTANHRRGRRSTAESGTSDWLSRATESTVESVTRWSCCEQPETGPTDSSSSLKFTLLGLHVATIITRCSVTTLPYIWPTEQNYKLTKSFKK